MTPTDATQLLDGYRIERLELKHITWVQAIIGHTLSFDSALWAEAPYEGGQTQRAYDMYVAIGPSADECIRSGLSYGVFKEDWKPHFDDTNPGGQLRWDTANRNANKDELLKQMDFPLVSVAMTKRTRGKGEAKPHPGDEVKKWHEIIPLFGTISAAFKKQEADNHHDFLRDLEDKEKKIARRSGTHTRFDYRGKKLMKALAHYIMDELAKEFDMVAIQSTSETVTQVWENPPEGYKATVTGVFNTAEYLKKDKDGEMVHPFGAAKVVCKKIYVDLKPRGGASGEGSGGA